MIRFYEWHTDRFDVGLVTLAGLICLFACLVSLSLAVGRENDAPRRRAILLAAAVFGAGLCATLFAFMLAFHLRLPIPYQIGITVLSVGTAMLMSWFGMTAVRLSTNRHGLGEGMSASLSAAWRGQSLRNRLAAASLLTLAICGLDFVAIRGVPAKLEPPANVSPKQLGSLADERMIEGSVDKSNGAMSARPAPAARTAPSTIVPSTIVPSTVVPSSVVPSPKEIAALAARIAIAQKIDPLLVLAIIETESAFQVGAVSAGNAQGLMQLMPETARRFGAKNLLDPAENIRAGIKYLHWLLAYFEGDVSLALAAYNAGEGAVLRYGGVPPYPETLAYVQKIRTRYPAARHDFDQVVLR
jgi:NO-binding membrane sensor protein with MHYT domain